MNQKRNHYLAIAMGVCAALLATHIGESACIPVILLIGVLSIWSLKNPSAGLLAVLPLAYMIQPAPVTLSWHEIGFAFLLIVSTVAMLYHERKLLLKPPRNMYIAAILMIVGLGLNLLTAYWHSVPLHDWIRGVTPFLFMLISIPVWLATKAHPELSGLLRLSAAITAGLFAFHVIQVYVSDELWRLSSYVFENGQWVKVIRSEAEAQGKIVLETLARVTVRLPQSTDVLLPLGAMWGTWAALYLRTRYANTWGLFLVIISTAAMTLTYTRSMLLTAGLLISLMVFFAIWQGRKLRSGLLLASICSSFIATVVIFDLTPIYANRLVSTQLQIKSFSAKAPETKAPETKAPETKAPETKAPETKAPETKAPETKAPETKAPDANIATRMEEYKIAWGLFSKSPLLGQGFGVRHPMRFDVGSGDFIEAQVGYVHNWVMYILMTGGLLGFAFYSALLIGPAWLAWKKVADRQLVGLVLVTVAGMAVYSLFFAVFRLIPFNLVLGGVWGLTLAAAYGKKESD